MKYEILKDEFIELDGRKLYRIKALKDFRDVRKGTVGGYIESEHNASLAGTARVSGDAWVSGNARVYGYAQVSGYARVSGNARVSGDAWVSGNARVYGNAQVSGYARVYGNARVSGDAWVLNRHSVVWFSNVGTENGTLTVYCGKNGLIATRGCFTGSVEDFLAKSAKVHDEKTKREYELLIEVARSRLEEAQGNIGSE